jgi:hypothetical protein
MQLRPHHLATVEHIAKRKHYHRSSQHAFMMENWNTIFGGDLRIKSKRVPSDELRKSLMLCSLLDLVDKRREEVHGPAK